MYSRGRNWIGQPVATRGEFLRGWETDPIPASLRFPRLDEVVTVDTFSFLVDNESNFLVDNEGNKLKALN